MPVIKQKTQFVNSAIGVSSFDTGADQVYQAVSNFANTVGKIAIDEGNKAAEQRGLKEAQSLTPEEVVEKSKQSPDAKGIQTIQAEAFDRVLERRFVDTIGNDIQLKSKEIAQKHQDPVSYERVFGNYLRDLTEGADDRFKGVVTSISKYEMADTKMTLAAAARSRARAAGKRSIANGNIQAMEMAYDAGVQGNVEGASQILQNRTEANEDGEKAGLLPKGATRTQVNNIAVAAISGLMNNMLPDVEDPAEQAAISVYFMTQGASQGDLIKEERKAQIDKFLPYVNLQTSGKIIQSMDSINSDLNQIRTVKKARAKAVSDRQMRADLINYGDTIESLEGIFSGAMGNIEPSSSLAVVQGNVNSVVTMFESAAFNIEQNFINTGAGTKDDVESDIKEIRRSALRTLGLAAAKEGNISAITSYLVNGDEAQIANLTPSQRAIVTTMRSKNIYTDDDREYIGSVLGASKDKVQAAIDKERRNFDLKNSVDAAAARIQQGITNPEELAEVAQAITGAVNSGDINAARGNELSAFIGESSGIGIVNLAASVANSSDLEALTNYIKSSGTEDLGINDLMRNVGDAVIAATPAGKLKSVSNHANGLREKMQNKENDTRLKQEELQNFNRVRANGGQSTNPKDRERADKIISQELNVDLTNPELFGNPEVMALLRSSMSDVLLNGLNGLGANLLNNPKAAESYMKYYMALSKDPSAQGGFTNRFGRDGSLISMDKQAFLNDVAEIYKNTDEPVLQIAQRLSDARSSTEHKELVKSRFKDKTTEQYLLELYDSYKIAEDFGATLEYYAGKGLSDDAIKANLDVFIEGIYVKSNLVRDPMVPLTIKNRTPFAVETIIPDEQRRDAFLNLIASELPDGFRLATSSATQKQGDLGALYAQDFTTPNLIGGIDVVESDTQVYLVPRELASPATGEKLVSYFLHYADNAELKPLIIEKDGQPFAPMYNMEDPEMVAYETQRAMEDYFDEQSEIDAYEQSLIPDPEVVERINKFSPTAMPVPNR